MDETSQQKLKEILRKEPNSLTPADIIFMKARRAYLQEKYLEKFAVALGEATPVEEVVLPDPTDTLAEGEHPSYRDLQKRAGELGVNRVVGKTRDELNILISEREPK